MIDVKDVANRALYRPQVYVPALVDEIQRLRREVQHYRAGLTEVQDLCYTEDVLAIKQSVRDTLYALQNQDTAC